MQVYSMNEREREREKQHVGDCKQEYKREKANQRWRHEGAVK